MMIKKIKNQLNPNKIRYIIILPIIFILEGFFSIIIFVLCVGLPIAFFVFIVKVLYKYLKTKSEYYQTRSQYYWTKTQYYNLHMNDRQD